MMIANGYALLEQIQSGASAFWFDAITPLHGLSWQTGVLFLGLLVGALAIAGWIMRVSWRFPGAKPAIAGAQIKPNHHAYADHLRVSLPNYLSFHGLSAETKLNSTVLDRYIKADAQRFYVVTIVESSKRKPVLYKELRLHMPVGNRWRPNPDHVQLDQAALTEVRLANGFDDDDDPQSGVVSGLYDIYIRQVRWYDIRHWLTHPNREIRIVLWVTIITTTLPTFIDVLFG
jgi:hypothetical protein